MNSFCLVTIAAQPIFEYDIPQLTRQHVEAIRSKKVEHVKMSSKESQTEPPERKKSEDYSSQTPQLEVKDEKSQAKVLAHEIAMQTTKPKSGVDAPSQTNVQRNSTMELTDSFSQTKEILRKVAFFIKKFKFSCLSSRKNFGELLKTNIDQKVAIKTT